MTNGISFNFEDNVGLSFSKIEYPKAFESKASVPAKFGTAEDTQREFGGNSVYIHAISPSARVDQLDDGIEVTVIDKDGKTSARVYNGKGEKGDRGSRGEQGVGISTIHLNSDYTLTLVLTDGTRITTGSVRGDVGPEGPKGDTGPKGIQGDKGDKGDTGVGIAKARLNDDYTLTLIFTDGNTFTTPSIRGEQGDGSDYEKMANIPSINGVQVEGDKTLSDYGDRIVSNREIKDIIDTQFAAVFGGN